MTDEKQLIWNQYQQLSEEIKSADTLNYQVIGIIVAAAVALLNAGFGKPSVEDRCWILLSIYIVTIFGRFLLEVGRTRIWRVATYLEIFLEPDLQGVKWQHRLNARPRAALRTNIIRTEFWLISGLDIIASVLIIATSVEIGDPIKRIAFSAAAIGLGLQSVLRAVRRRHQFDRGGDVHEANKESWQAVKKKEEQLSSAGRLDTPRV